MMTEAMQMVLRACTNIAKGHAEKAAVMPIVSHMETAFVTHKRRVLHCEAKNKDIVS